MPAPASAATSQPSGSAKPTIPVAQFAPPGPPFVAHVEGRSVYDEAAVLSPTTVTIVENVIAAIHDRTGAEIVVHTRPMGRAVSPGEAERDAQELMTRWALGTARQDGLVILFELDASKVHGQVQLYAGDGFGRAYLSNAERQAIFDTKMVPFLASGDLDGAILAAMNAIDAALTADKAAQLSASASPSPSGT
jgi:uncharacterized membrane protein YgcG